MVLFDVLSGCIQIRFKDCRFYHSAFSHSFCDHVGRSVQSNSLELKLPLIHEPSTHKVN